jgi:hypothetical protein
MGSGVSKLRLSLAKMPPVTRRASAGGVLRRKNPQNWRNDQAERHQLRSRAPTPTPKRFHTTKTLNGHANRRRGHPCTVSRIHDPAQIKRDRGASRLSDEAGLDGNQAHKPPSTGRTPPLSWQLCSTTALFERKFTAPTLQAACFGTDSAGESGQTSFPRILAVGGSVQK